MDITGLKSEQVMAKQPGGFSCETVPNLVKIAHHHLACQPQYCHNRTRQRMKKVGREPWSSGYGIRLVF